MVTKVWQRKLDYAKNLQAKYFAGENIPIYSIRYTDNFYHIGAIVAGLGEIIVHQIFQLYGLYINIVVPVVWKEKGRLQLPALSPFTCRTLNKDKHT